MKFAILGLSIVLFLLPAIAADAPTELSLMDGSKIKGKVTSSNGAEVTVMSDFGVFRIPVEKLTPESRQSVTQSTKPDTDSLLRRISELEAKVAQLQQENESLRKQVVTTPVPAYRPSGTQSLKPSGASSGQSSGLQYTMSSTGKRHNSHCRYFGTGRACGPTDGVACKICGG